MKQTLALALAGFGAALVLAAAGCNHKQPASAPPAPSAAVAGNQANAKLPPIPANAPSGEVQMLQNNSGMPAAEKAALIRQMGQRNLSSH